MIWLEGVKGHFLGRKPWRKGPVGIEGRVTNSTSNISADFKGPVHQTGFGTSL